MQMQRGCDNTAALKLLRKLLYNQPVKPEIITTDGLASYPAGLDELNLRHLHRPGRLRDNNRAENSHLPVRRRERKMQGFKSQRSAQRFLTTYAAIYNAFDIQRHINRRPYMKRLRYEATREWMLCAASNFRTHRQDGELHFSSQRYSDNSTSSLSAISLEVPFKISRAQPERSFRSGRQQNRPAADAACRRAAQRSRASPLVGAPPC